MCGSTFTPPPFYTPALRTTRANEATPTGPVALETPQVRDAQPSRAETPDYCERRRRHHILQTWPTLKRFWLNESKHRGSEESGGAGREREAMPPPR